MDNRLPRQERISKRSDIERLFTHGEAFLAYPVKATYRTRLDGEGDPANRVMVMVSKRNVKRAVGRNRMKRRMREAYRLNKQLLGRDVRYDIALSYIAKDGMLSEYRVVEQAVIKILKRLSHVKE